MKDSWRKEKEVKKKSCTRAWCGVLAAALVVTSTSSVMLAEAAKAPKTQQKNDNFARWGQKTAQSEKFKEKAEGKVEIQ